MKDLGTHRASDENTYIIRYYSNDNVAEAIGPLAPAGLSGSCGIFVKVENVNGEEDAWKKVAKAIEDKIAK